ncbi:cytochrome b5-like [Leptopilina heterotoma]|uniref:cytochrome b5-like n=1 Tax=Leptopilina heterotoma TaxID=63436 RepID=UPI001CA8FC09|nr:cytochrome b5-like [Leptopilina heterotoma]
MNLISIEEVRKNNGQNGSKIWVVLHKNVYDLTQYIKEHPGGDELIMEFAGKDGTKGFNDFGHTSDARTYMKKFKIGELAEDCCKQSKKSSKTEEITRNNAERNRRSILTKLWLCS